MGTNQGALKYHRFTYRDKLSIIVAEYPAHNYVWLSFFLVPSLRNGRVADQLTRYVIYVLKGTHHIHFFPHLATFRRLARELNWVPDGLSVIFNNCVAYHTSSPSRPPDLGPLVQLLLRQHCTSRRPHLPTIATREDERAVPCLIRKLFDR
jgi:hypothetical protein